MTDSRSAIELTKQLINIPSASGHEAEILFFLKNWLKNSGYKFVHRDSRFVAAKIRGKSSHRAFILSGHIDTVVPGDRTTWKISPYEAVEELETGHLVGLGASDMLSGVAGNLTVANQFKEEELDFDLWVVATANEELDGQGSADFVHWFKVNTSYESAACLISEPSDLEQIEIGQRGNRFLSFDFQGMTGHGSIQGNYQKSAFSKLSRFLIELDEIVGQLAKFENPILGRPSLVPTAVNAGNPKAPNKTASRADLTVDLRTTPELDENFDTYIHELSQKYDFSWKYAANPVSSTLVDPKLPFIQKLAEVAKIDQLVASASSNDSGFFQEVGIPAIIFGPGSMDQAHQANEFVEISKLIAFTEILTEFLKNY